MGPNETATFPWKLLNVRRFYLHFTLAKGIPIKSDRWLVKLTNKSLRQGNFLGQKIKSQI